MQREYPHNTDEQTTDYLRRTLAIVREAGISPGEFPAVFPVVYNSVAGKQIVVEQTQLGPAAAQLLRGH